MSDKNILKIKKTSVLYIVFGINKALAFEWITSYIDREKFEISFILLNSKPSYLKQFLNQRRIKCIEYKHSSFFNLPINFLKILRYLLKHEPDVIHTHLRDANLIGLFVGGLVRIKKRIYSRHHSTLYHEYRKGIALLIDRFCNYFATNIIATNKNVANVLQERENVLPEKIRTIYHGFDLSKFNQSDCSLINQMKIKYGLSNRYPVVGVIARYEYWKGIQHIIPAFKRLLINYPNAVLMLANAKKGDAVSIIENQLNDLPNSSYIEIPFEDDIFTLYQLFNVFVHVPIDKSVEAFGQIYVEALAAGIPSIFTMSGIAHEFIQHEENALVVDYKNSEEIYQSLVRLLESKELKKYLIKNGKKSIEAIDDFKITTMIQKLEELYS